MTAALVYLQGGCMALSDVHPWQSHKQSAALRQKFFFAYFFFQEKVRPVRQDTVT
jgi:hypothetical protein